MPYLPRQMQLAVHAFLLLLLTQCSRLLSLLKGKTLDDALGKAKQLRLRRRRSSCPNSCLPPQSRSVWTCGQHTV